MSRIVTRWEKQEAPDGYEHTHFGRLLVVLTPPPRGQGWQKVKRDVSTPACTLLAREDW